MGSFHYSHNAVSNESAIRCRELTSQQSFVPIDHIPPCVRDLPINHRHHFASNGYHSRSRFAMQQPSWKRSGLHRQKRSDRVDDWRMRILFFSRNRFVDTTLSMCPMQPMVVIQVMTNDPPDTLTENPQLESMIRQSQIVDDSNGQRSQHANLGSPESSQVWNQRNLIQ